MAFKTSDIDIMYVRNGLDHNSLDLGTLCLFACFLNSAIVAPFLLFSSLNYS